MSPSERKEKVEQGMLLPTFMFRKRPITDICCFLPISELTEEIDAATTLGMISSLESCLLKQLAEYITQVDNVLAAVASMVSGIDIEPFLAESVSVGVT